MKTVDAAAEARARRAFAATGNRDAMDAANAMLAAFNPHGGYEDAALLGAAKTAGTGAAGGGGGGPTSSPVAHGPETEATSPVAQRVSHVDAKTLADAQAVVATAAHDAEGSGAQDVSTAQTGSAVSEDSGLAAHAAGRGGGAGFHEDPFAHLENTAAADPLQSGKLVGDDGANTLSSGAGVVMLFGGRGDDTLVSNGDGDRLIGGGGADTFVFSAFETSKVGVIENLGRGDVVDLSQAAAQFGLDHFTAVTAYDGQAGEVLATFDAAHDRTVFKFDTNGDGHTDYRLVVDHGDYTDFSHFLDVDHSALVV